MRFLALCSDQHPMLRRLVTACCKMPLKRLCCLGDFSPEGDKWGILKKLGKTSGAQDRSV